MCSKERCNEPGSHSWWAKKQEANGDRTDDGNGHEFWPKPTRVTVELMLAERMARYEINLVPFFNKSKCDLPSGDPATDDNDVFLGNGPTIESGFKDVMDTGIALRCPLWPFRLFACTQGEDNIGSVNALPIGEFDGDMATVESAGLSSCLDVKVGETICPDDLFTVLVKE